MGTVSISVRGEHMPQIMMNIARKKKMKVGDLVYEALYKEHGAEIERQLRIFFADSVDQSQHECDLVNE